eukprot:15283682-Heterocapsa_arctica.AAC.1
MGFSWSLYFCQRMVERSVEDCGISRDQVVIDRQIAPRVDGPHLAGAVYVDGAAVIGSSSGPVDKKILEIKQALDRVGL